MERNDESISTLLIERDSKRMKYLKYATLLIVAIAMITYLAYECEFYFSDENSEYYEIVTYDEQDVYNLPMPMLYV